VAVAGSRRKTPSWADVRWLLLAQGGRRPAGLMLGHKAGWAVFFTGLARQGEEGEMGGLHRRLGPKLKRNRN
jgi:hypothetical protein